MVNFICQVDWLGVAWIKHYFWVCLWWCLERLAFKSLGSVDYPAQRGWWWWWCSVTQSCPVLCDSMDYSTPGLPVPHQLPNFVQACPLLWWCHPAIPLLFCPQSFPASGTFLMSQLFTSDDQSTGVSVSALVLSMSIQGWFLLWLNCLISLLSKGLSEVLSSITVWRHQFFGAPPSLWSSSHNCMWPLGRP